MPCRLEHRFFNSSQCVSIFDESTSLPWYLFPSSFSVNRVILSELPVHKDLLQSFCPGRSSIETHWLKQDGETALPSWCRNRALSCRCRLLETPAPCNSESVSAIHSITERPDLGDRRCSVGTCGLPKMFKYFWPVNQGRENR